MDHEEILVGIRKTVLSVVFDGAYGMRYQTTRRNALRAGSVLLAGATFVGVTSARPRNFNTHLTSDAHEGSDTNAQGQANFQLRDGQFGFKLIVANIEDVTMGHIHLDAVDGPVSVWLHDFATAAPDPVEGRVNGVLSEGTITDDEVEGPIETVGELVDEIDAGNAFVNVHTDAFPGGEIGGRISARN